MDRTVYREVKPTPAIWMLAVIAGAFIAAAGLAVLYIEHHGHIVTGMTNQIVWGLPHVFAIFLIVAASGALNVASIASVFGKIENKPMARYSGLLSIALLAGGLAVLVLDLGRPDRLIVAMTKYNFSSIFAWNVILYNGFFAVVGAYLFVQMARNISPKVVKTVGTAAFVWRLALTTGTGSIFGWLVARPGYDAAIMAPLFIIMSFSFGLAFFILVLGTTYPMTGRYLGPNLMKRLGRLLGIFALAVLYFTAVRHLTNLYAAEHGDFEHFMLFGDTMFPKLFWIVQVLIGGLIPAAILLRPADKTSKKQVLFASLLIIIGGFAHIYNIVIGGQIFPLEIFPMYQASSSFFDGQLNSYSPTIYEWALGMGGVALAVMIAGVGVVAMRILPMSLSDRNIDPSEPDF
ncbi:MAG TPA: molybdopterin oxidoreductase [Rhodobacteraceae bacterium]|nr:molybdopterin oxidoreductase [Paracoccaceae bacterium]